MPVSASSRNTDAPARPTPERRVPLPDEDATTRLGEALARTLTAGDTLLLSGPIGAGKSHLARALIRAAARAGGLPAPEVPSPTYTLVQTYETALGEIVHADLYRLGDTSELAEIGLDAAFGAALCIVEWPDRLGAGTPADALALSIATDGEGRIATLSTRCAQVDDRLSEMLKEFTA